MVKPKTRTISTRVREPLYEFLVGITKELSKATGSRITLGDLLRNIIEYFFLAYTLGSWTKPLPELRKEFRDFLNTLSKSEPKKSSSKTKNGKVEYVL
jgi:hypothetical protein